MHDGQVLPYVNKTLFTKRIGNLELRLAKKFLKKKEKNRVI